MRPRSSPSKGSFLRAALVLSAVLGASGRTASAATFSFTGTFTHDDDKQFFTFSIASTTTVTIRTFGFGGGTNGASTVIPAGGFDPIIQFFDSLGGGYGLSNDDPINMDGTCPHVTKDPASGACWDSYYSQPVTAGTYTLVLTQSDNQYNGPNLSDGFHEDGMGDFTVMFDIFFLGPPFITEAGDKRNGNWALDISGVDSATLGPLLPVTLTRFTAE